MSAPAITRCSASDSGSPSLTGRCQDVSDRVGTGSVAEGFPLERILSARVFITICDPENFVCNVQEAVTVPTYNHAVIKGTCEICYEFTCT